MFTIVELIGNINDENSFKRQKTILKKLASSKFKIDQALPEEIFLEAFNIPIKSDVSDQIADLMLRVIFYDSYQNWIAYETSITPHPNIYEYVQMTDKQKRFGQVLEKKWSDNTTASIAEFNEFWNENNSRDEILTRIVNYYIDKRKKAFPKYADIIRYKWCIDLFMLVHTYYVGKKVSYHDPSGRNDFQDLMHLLYVRQGMTLVTDDRHLRENVNKVCPDRAITTEDFLKAYNNCILN